MYNTSLSEQENFTKEVSKLREIPMDRLEAMKFEGSIASKEHAVKEAAIAADEILKCPIVKAVGLFGSSVENDIQSPKDFDFVIFVEPAVAERFMSKYNFIDVSAVSFEAEEDEEFAPLQAAMEAAKKSTAKFGLSERPMDAIILPEKLDQVEASLLVMKFVSKNFLKSVLEKCVMYDKKTKKFDSQLFPPVSNDVWEYLR